MLDRFLTGMSERFSVQKSGTKQFCGAVVSIDPRPGRPPRSSAFSGATAGADAVKVDLSRAYGMSDGTLCPQELADFMGERGVEIFSISDHDTLAAYGTSFRRRGARVITGHRDQYDLAR